MGQFQFARIPFGICNSGAIFQNVMNDILADLLRDHPVFSYVDDIFVGGDDPFELIRLVERILEELEKARFKINPEKCRIGVTELCILGNLLLEAGMKPNPEKVHAIEHLAKPTNRKELESLMGLLNYFRKFVSDYALITAPLRQLLHQNVSWQWAEPHDEAVTTLTQRLMEPPILIPFDSKKKIIVNVDGSGKGIGAAVGHQINGKFHPVAYTSKTLSEAEKNYSICEIEFLAIIHALKKFRHFLYGQDFQIMSDHLALSSLRFAKKHGYGRIIRWAVQMLEFPGGKINYRPGSLNTIADALSRLPAPGKEDDEVEEDFVFPLFVNGPQPFDQDRIWGTKENLLTLQKKDPSVKRSCLNWRIQGHQNIGLLSTLMEAYSTKEAAVIVLSSHTVSLGTCFMNPTASLTAGTPDLKKPWIGSSAVITSSR
jgi:hypothetical protein